MKKAFLVAVVVGLLSPMTSQANIAAPPPFDECEDKQLAIGVACHDSDGNVGTCQNYQNEMRCLTPANQGRFSGCSELSDSSSALLSILSIALGSFVVLRCRRRRC